MKGKNLLQNRSLGCGSSVLILVVIGVFLSVLPWLITDSFEGRVIREYTWNTTEGAVSQIEVDVNGDGIPDEVLMNVDDFFRGKMNSADFQAHLNAFSTSVMGDEAPVCRFEVSGFRIPLLSVQRNVYAYSCQIDG